MLIPLDHSNEIIEWIGGFRGETYHVANDKKLINGHALILCENSVDSLCAVKIMLSIFQAENIPYTLIPVSSEQSISGAYVKEQYVYYKDTSAKGKRFSIIFINFGGRMDINSLLFSEDDDSSEELVRVFIFDSHRPVHLSNIFSSHQIVLLDDGTLASKGEDIWPHFERVHLLDEDEQVEDPQRFGKSERILERYYQNEISRNSVSMASYIYAMASQLNLASGDLLWVCMLGTAAAFLLQDASDNNTDFNHKWEDSISLLKGEVGRFFPRNSAPSKAELIEYSSILKHQNSCITLEEELALPLLRLWNIYESVLFSPLAHRRLKLFPTTTLLSYGSNDICSYPTEGKASLEVSPCPSLDTLLAKLGIPLDLSKQPVVYLDRQLFKRFVKQIKIFLHNSAEEPMIAAGDSIYGHLTRWMFVRSMPGQGRSSAIDQAHMLLTRMSLFKNHTQGFFNALESLNFSNNNEKSDDLSTWIKRSLSLQRCKLLLCYKLMKDRALKTLRAQGYRIVILNKDKYSFTFSQHSHHARNASADPIFTDLIDLLANDARQRILFAKEYMEYIFNPSFSSNSGAAWTYPLLIAVLNSVTKHYDCSISYPIYPASTISDGIIETSFKKAYYLLTTQTTDLSILDEAFFSSLPDAPCTYYNFSIPTLAFPKFVQLFKIIQTPIPTSDSRRNVISDDESILASQEEASDLGP